MNPEFWRHRRVFLTGHTGFKGGWLALWMQSMGAEVHGYALNPQAEPNFFSVARIEEGMATSTMADIRDTAGLAAALLAAAPEIVLHSAAQPLVRYSYAEPLETYAINVMGTVNLLEAVRSTPSVRAVVNITTDKCYENREWTWPYRENDAMGGHDPYSSSKACSEILTGSWRRSFLEDRGVAVATARAGNVIGGGDWAAGRLIPDILNAVDRGEPVRIRSPEAVRPWQHVLAPLSGYLNLAECLLSEGRAYAEAWNFGPADEDAQSVRWIVERLTAAFPGASWACEPGSHPHEAQSLRLDSSKARARLGWKPRWRLETALQKTIDWHGNWRHARDMRDTSLTQIADYVASKATA